MSQFIGQFVGPAATLQESLLIRMLRQSLDFGHWFLRELLWPSLAGVGLLLLLANQANANPQASGPAGAQNSQAIVAAPVGPEVGPLAGLRAVWLGGCVTPNAASSVRAFEIYAVADLGRSGTSAVQALVQIAEENQSPGQLLHRGRIEAQQVLWSQEGIEFVLQGRNIPRQILRIPRAVKPMAQVTTAQNANVGFVCRLAPMAN
ncbi:MAG TPA: hypothetical protein PLZ57_13130 [Pseudobdellovibrionaceae bacterium]|nr:hypothetical protein [Pseudobdellovibrionaceae bacterium]